MNSNLIMFALRGRTLLSIPRNYCSSFAAKRKAAAKEKMKTINPVRQHLEEKRKNHQLQTQRLVGRIRQFKQEYARSVNESPDDDIGEPDLSQVNLIDDERDREKLQYKDQYRRKRMTKKYFKEFEPRELNLLTWAEKENIRYLVDTDPGEWTPETIAQAYPISPDGVDKLLRSKMRLKTVKEVRQHDQRITEKINLIKNGQIAMTEDLRERMEIRDLIPVKAGDLGIHGQDLIDTEAPQPLKEFALLVAPKQKVEVPPENRNANVKYIAEGDILYKDNATNGATKQELTKMELSKILRTRGLMTFSEFESKMQRSQADKLAGDMEYMLNLNESEYSPDKEKKGVTSGEYFGESGSTTEAITRPQKYKSSSEQQIVTIEGEKGYMYNEKTGYQKPFESEEDSYPKERIEIPQEHRKPGALYKLGNSYYSEDGEFLYRIP